MESWFEPSNFLNSHLGFSGMLILIGSFLFSWLLLVWLKKLSLKYGILVSKNIPLIGGVSTGLAFYLTLFLCRVGGADLSRPVAGILVASVVMLVSGVIDDRRELSVRQKFFIQMVAASVLVISGVRMNVIFLGDAMNVILSFLWIIGITNAVNLLDVMDGLAGATSLIILLGFSAVAFLSHDTATLVLSLALGGAVLGFLCFNLPPAKIYMGNSGSHFLGILLASIGLTARYAVSDREIALLSPVLILGFPIFDTFFLILMRVKKGKSAFNKSNDHLALRFLKIGHSKGRTLVMMLLWTTLFVFAGALLPGVSNLVSWIVLVFIGFSTAILGRKMGRVEV